MEQQLHERAQAMSERKERGMALLAFLLLAAIGAVVAAGALTLASNDLRSNDAATTRSEHFFEVESALGQAVSWFRANSKNMIAPFSRAEFYNRFDRTAPTIGSNDSSLFTIPTRVKIKGTSNSALLVSANTLGSGAFPTTWHINTNAPFDPATSFTTAASGDLLFRATLVDAIAVDPSKDYGPPPAAAPQTEFYPIYRLDVMSALDRGAHIYGYVVGAVTYSDVVGFYGRDFMEVNQNCDSYISADGAYGGANKRAHCPVGSNGPLYIQQNDIVYGSARTNGAILGAPPWGGRVCSDFASGCPNPGQTCQGADCAVPGLPSVGTWASYCPTNQGDRNVNTNQTWTVGGPGANQKCWNNVTIGNNRTLTLTSTNYPYFFKTLSIPNNGRLNIQPNPATGVVTIYVENISGNNVNGNQVFNGNNRPSQLRFYYLGTNDLTLNGTATFNAAMISPNAGITLSGNFTYQGGILAESLVMTGSGNIHYDESLGGSVLDDATYRLRNLVQYYR